VTEPTRSAEEYLPAEMAETVISPKSYKNDNVIYPAFKWIRKNNPLGIANVAGYDRIWIVSKHADIMKIGRDQNLYHNADSNPILNSQAGDEFTRNTAGGTYRIISSLPMMDPPEHRVYRDITQDWSQPANMKNIEGSIRELAKRSVEKFMDFDGECDFYKDFALFYPLRVIMTLFGVPPSEEPRMLKLTQELFGANDPEVQAATVKAVEPDAAARTFHAALQSVYGYFSELTQLRRNEPTEDLLSLIANTKINGEYIADAEANGYYVTIATAGHDTTSASTASGLLGLIEFGDQFQKIKANPALTAGLADEAIRWASPVKHFMRNATRDTELRGRQIKAGDRLMLCFPSGNRDEEVFKDPDKFDIERRPNRHLAFGYGAHMCVGQHLAKMEIRVLFEELLPKLKSIELAGPPRFTETNFVGGIKSLPIRFTKA
jgi:cytochrome P450